MRSLLLAASSVLLAGCSPRPPMTPAERQDFQDYIHSICDFQPSDTYEQQICAQPFGLKEKADKLKSHRTEQGKP